MEQKLEDLRKELSSLRTNTFWQDHRDRIRPLEEGQREIARDIEELKASMASLTRSFGIIPEDLIFEKPEFHSLRTRKVFKAAES